MNKLALLIVTLLAGALIVGCSGGDDASTKDYGGPVKDSGKEAAPTPPDGKPAAGMTVDSDR